MIDLEVRALCAQIAMQRNEGIYDALVAELTRVLSKETMLRPATAKEVWPGPPSVFPQTDEIVVERPLEKACTTAVASRLQI
jgi:hypothetical protein